MICNAYCIASIERDPLQNYYFKAIHLQHSRIVSSKKRWTHLTIIIVLSVFHSFRLQQSVLSKLFSTACTNNIKNQRWAVLLRISPVRLHLCIDIYIYLDCIGHFTSTYVNGSSWIKITRNSVCQRTNKGIIDADLYY